MNKAGKIDKIKAEGTMRKWKKLLRLDHYDIKLEFVQREWRKSGDIKIDDCNHQAVLMLNTFNPSVKNSEEVIIHELLHLRLWELDQLTESLINNLYGEDESDPRREVIYTEFMKKLESTTQEITKALVTLGAENKETGFSYVQKEVEQELRKK
ncbi:MAG: hypothetical protein R6V47_06065 [Candidatus Delongbacteria bacterium]